MRNKNKEESKVNEESETHFEVKARMFGRATFNKFAFAKEQRLKPTKTEALLWSELRAKKLNGFKFRRQHPYGRFVLDFYCVQQKMSIEIDGKIHNTPENIEYDAVRTKILQDNGIVEIRFSNEEIIRDMKKVLSIISEKLNELKADNQKSE